MIRLILGFLLCANVAIAQDFSGLAQIDPAQTSVATTSNGLQIDVHLSQTVPYRVSVTDAPRRLVLEFREIDWSNSANLLPGVGASYRNTADGWSQLFVPLPAPMIVAQAGMKVDETTATARVTVQLEEVSSDVFALRAKPIDQVADVPQTVARDGPMVVVIDPGHGGLDPGAERGGASEADLMLRLGIEASEALARAGIRTVMTRQADEFVPLSTRMTRAREAGASLMISLHADALEEDQARGASVYTLTTAAVDAASQRMAERHERGDLLGGVDLSDQGDRVATVLMDLARLETVPQSSRFADTLVAAFRGAGVRMNSRPRREGRLAVLNAADFASVLVEVGFLSSARDREMLSSPQGRAPLVAGLVDAVQRWTVDEAARAPLVRQ